MFNLDGAFVQLIQSYQLPVSTLNFPSQFRLSSFISQSNNQAFGPPNELRKVIDYHDRAPSGNILDYLKQIMVFINPS